MSTPDPTAEGGHPHHRAHGHASVGGIDDAELLRMDAGQTSEVYRCKHMIVDASDPDQYRCFICGVGMNGRWRKVWEGTGVHSPSRPRPIDHGIQRVEVK